MKRILKTYPLAILLLFAIVWLSLGTPPKSGLEGISGIDKVVHFLMYFGLDIIIWFEYLRHHDTPNWKKLSLFAVIGPVAFSGAMEIAQMTLTSNRQGEWLDFFANSIGVIAATLFSWYCMKPLLWRSND